MFNLTSVKYVYSSAAPLGAETVQKLKDQYPRWDIGQGYVCTTSQVDVNFGSSGSLVPLARAKIIDLDTGAEITKYDCPGELLVQSPTVSLGYLSNDDANEETFVSSHDGRWVRTGDKALFRTAPSGHEHMFVVGRIKELIKVKGYQVAPAELEALILTHKAISDCAVVGVPHEEAGEVPMAYVVRSVGCDEITSETIVSEILQLIKETKPRHKWIRGGITFVHEIPRNSRGKILRQQLGRDV
ncbi:AMP-binding enzyme [Colletotrichum chrysophilum]|uniref:AMP-binding enzyme n=1 Tax=Colletotrichum chrysophilum TaxID=1836956 RepID=A0AAD9E6W3_9PEZI|nr:AMP-binding enzyme [Colletotrichum chrysophilum]